LEQLTAIRLDVAGMTTDESEFASLIQTIHRRQGPTVAWRMLDAMVNLVDDGGSKADILKLARTKVSDLPILN
jgi:hypothetical protein